jgi:FKBP-type peptidyl-prolyl cis-trans isomerase FkpA
MTKRIVLIIWIIPFLVLGCSRFSKYPGYKKAKHGVYYQLHTMGEDTLKPHPGDYITVNLTYMTLNDSAFFDGTRRLQLSIPAYPGAIDECFAMLSAQESATFIIPADNFFSITLQTPLPRFIKPGSDMKIKVDMLEIQSQQEYAKQKEAFLSWIEDFGEYEKVILRQYIQEEKLNVKPLPSGIYYLVLHSGTGKQVENGDTLTVNYEGKFLNGKFFDSTIKRKQPFQFVYGTEMQVIKGLEEGIGLMHEGEKALFILPSEMAFGTKGSSNQMIPPFTSLIFEVEILKVSSPNRN